MASKVSFDLLKNHIWKLQTNISGNPKLFKLEREEIIINSHGQGKQCRNTQPTKHIKVIEKHVEKGRQDRRLESSSSLSFQMVSSKQKAMADSRIDNQNVLH